MRSIQVMPASVEEAGVVDLLALAAGPGQQRIEETVQRYRDDSAAVLLVAIANHIPVGVAGYTVSQSEIVLLHIATALDARRTGVGRRLLTEVRRAGPGRLPLVAETDADSLGFYVDNDFAVQSLGEKYPGVEMKT
jgi:GNAT superfamily N-acetyltransferase